MTEQQYGRDSRLTLDGTERTVRDWAKSIGMEPNTLLYRLNTGLDLQEALTKPILKMNKAHKNGIRLLTVKGETMTIDQWSKRSGTPASTINSRIRAGWAPSLCVYGRKIRKARRVRVARVVAPEDGSKILVLVEHEQDLNPDLLLTFLRSLKGVVRAEEIRL